MELLGGGDVKMCKRVKVKLDDNDGECETWNEYCVFRGMCLCAFRERRKSDGRGEAGVDQIGLAASAIHAK